MLLTKLTFNILFLSEMQAFPDLRHQPKSPQKLYYQSAYTIYPPILRPIWTPLQTIKCLWTYGL